MTTTPLSTAQTSDLQQLLRQRQRDLERSIDARLHASGESEVAISSGDAGDDGEATDAAIANLERQIARLAEINTALDKFAPDSTVTYGDCEDCGDAIGYARLLAHPGARLCLKCQNAAELRDGAAGDSA